MTSDGTGFATAVPETSGLHVGIHIVETSNTALCTARFDIEDALCSVFNGFPEYMELFIRIVEKGCKELEIPFNIEGRYVISEKWNENNGRPIS